MDTASVCDPITDESSEKDRVSGFGAGHDSLQEIYYEIMYFYVWS